MNYKFNKQRNVKMLLFKSSLETSTLKYILFMYLNSDSSVNRL